MYQTYIYIFFKYILHNHGVYIGIHTGDLYHYLSSAGHVQGFGYNQLSAWYGKLLQQISPTVWSPLISVFLEHWHNPGRIYEFFSEI